MPGRLPTTKDFPENLKVGIVSPTNKSDPPTNILLLLHGLGDTLQPFEKLGSQLNLPETVCISLQGPKTLLDLGGYHWGDDILFDSSTGGLDSDAGFLEARAVIKLVLQDILVAKCGYTLRDVVVFGFGQGGMAGLDAAVGLHEAASSSPKEGELGGVVSIGGGMPSSAAASLNPACKTPVLVCAGSSASSVTPTAEEKVKRCFEFVEVSRYRKAGDAMPSNRKEMMPIMQFFGRRLKSRKGVPEGAVELG
ncbi:hypothetical protein MBLNU230_g4795t1 [Neophaeotheca triangularis]